MTFTCEYTSTGWLVDWSSKLQEGESLAFYAGDSSSDLTQRFTSAVPSGTVSVTAPGNGPLPGAVGRLDVMNGTTTVRTTGVRPLVPGLTSRDALCLFRLADNHARACVLRGDTGSLYRKRTTGEACTACVDPLTGAQIDPDCAVCGGSGYVTGWIGPFTVSVLFTQPLAETTVSTGVGVSQEAVLGTVRMSALPRPRAEDILDMRPRGQVFILGHPQRPVAGVAGIPAVVECSVRLPDLDNPDASPPEEVGT